MKFLVLVALSVSNPAFGQEHTKFELEILGGAPVNVDTRFKLTQDGFSPLEFTGSYDSEPFTLPVYYAIRVSLAQATTSWSLELMHHKIFLKNPPSEINDFEVTHGFNILTLQRAWVVSSLRIQVGLGTVFAHPESQVRGRRFDTTGGILGAGYYIAGPVIGSGVAKRLAMSKTLFFTVEGRVTLAPVSVPVAGGDAHFTHLAFHGMFGFGGSF